VTLSLSYSLKHFQFALKLLLLVLVLLLSAPSRAADKVNINTATATELQQGLVNIGAAKAQSIVDYRQEHGAFKSADELVRVRGIGLRTVERNRDLIEVQVPSSAASNTTTKAPSVPATSVPRR